MANIVAGDIYYKLDGQLLEIKRQLRQPGGYPFDPTKLSDNLQSAIEGKFNQEGSEQIKKLAKNSLRSAQG